METEIDPDNPVRDILSRLRAMSADRDGDITLGEVVEAFGPASYVPALLVPALLVVSPLSGIPFFSSFCGITIALISLQMIIARDRLWLPGFVRSRHVPRQRLAKSIDRIRPVGDWIDRHTRPRVRLLFVWPVRLVPEALCVFCGTAMPFLEIVPFSSSILGSAVVCLSVGFLARDGAMTIAGFCIAGAAVTLAIFAVAGLVG